MVRSKRQRFDIRDEELFWELDEGQPSEPSPSEAWSPPAIEPVSPEIATAAVPDPSSSLPPDEDPAPAAVLLEDVAADNPRHARAFAVIALVAAVGAALMVSDVVGLVVDKLSGGGPEPTAQAHDRTSATEPRKQQASVLATTSSEPSDREVPGAAAARRERQEAARARRARREQRERARARQAARKRAKRAARTAAAQSPPAAQAPAPTTTAPAPTAPAPTTSAPAPTTPAPAPTTPAPAPTQPASPPADEFGFEQ